MMYALITTIYATGPTILDILLADRDTAVFRKVVYHNKGPCSSSNCWSNINHRL